tara:strand:- start:25829 stop:27127 length:1299 start_codon:yes stop_codon:yes gene_type:complete
MKFELSKVRIAVIGLGYVGYPLALELSKKYLVVGYDLDKSRLKELEEGYDSTKEITKEEITSLNDLSLTNSLEEIRDSNVYIITVPTPVDKNNKPDLSPIKSASKSVGRVLLKNDLVIYESTVFPGCTEEVCVPILEKYSKLKFNQHFFCGYSPERINPGDKKHTLTTIKKITSGSTQESADFIDALYKSVIPAGTYKVSSINVAEAAKVIENTQRDVNIALINELSIIFNKLNINTNEVLEAAKTKWNFLPFKPGLVGGHCIGVDPYYLTYKAKEIGYNPEIILAGRKINDGMGDYVALATIEALKKQNHSVRNAKVSILGLTFKENCPDLRNTKVISIKDKLLEYKCLISFCDYWADPDQAKEQYDINLVDLPDIKNQDAIIIAVEHDKFKNFNKNDIDHMLKPNGAFIDVKGLYDKNKFCDNKRIYWSL